MRHYVFRVRVEEIEEVSWFDAVPGDREFVVETYADEAARYAGGAEWPWHCLVTLPERFSDDEPEFDALAALLPVDRRYFVEALRGATPVEGAEKDFWPAEWNAIMRPVRHRFKRVLDKQLAMDGEQGEGKQ